MKTVSHCAVRHSQCAMQVIVMLLTVAARPLAGRGIHSVDSNDVFEIVVRTGCTFEWNGNSIVDVAL